MTKNMITFHYMHRDEGNYKDHLEAYYLDTRDRDVETLETLIQEGLIAGEFFYPQDVELERSFFADECDWHEFAGIEICPAEPGENKCDIDQFLELLAGSKRKRAPGCIIHTRPALISTRLFVSGLELRRKLNGVGLLAAIADLDTAVITMPKADWKLLQETLALDTKSASFDGALRRELGNALCNVQEW